jgi:nucleotide-binding universal stress UspA family protein
MRKKILVAIDASIHSRHALDYALQLSATVKEIDFLLFHVQPMISQYLVEEAVKRSQAKRELDKLYEKNRKAALQLLEECRERLIQQGISADGIETRTIPRIDGIAQDVVSFSEAGSYDAILVGRRGISGLQELLMGSVTANILASSQVTPVWIVNGPVKQENVLIAVDGSPNSLRTVDHVSFIFAGNRDVRLHFLNIMPRLGDYCEIDINTLKTAELEKALLVSNEKCISDFSAIAMGILKKAGFETDQVIFRSEKKKLFTGKAILETAKKEKFGTVVIAKTGAGQSRNMGKVASHVIQKMSDGAVWVVP